MRRWGFVLLLLSAFFAVANAQTVTIDSMKCSLPEYFGVGFDNYSFYGQSYTITTYFHLITPTPLPNPSRLRMRHRESCGGTTTTIRDTNLVGLGNGFYEWTVAITQAGCFASSYADSIFLRNPDGGNYTLDAPVHTIMISANEDVSSPWFWAYEPESEVDNWPTDMHPKVVINDNWAIYSAGFAIMNYATTMFWNGTAWQAAPYTFAAHQDSGEVWISNDSVFFPTDEPHYLGHFATDSAGLYNEEWMERGLMIRRIGCTLPNFDWFQAFANKNQAYRCSVYVNAQTNILANNDTLRLWRQDCTGTWVLMYENLLPAMAAGTERVFVYNFTTIDCIPPSYWDDIFVDLRGPDTVASYYHWLAVTVQDRGIINVDDVEAVADTFGNIYTDNIFTQGQTFYLQVIYTNTGVGSFGQIAFNLASTTDYDVASVFPSVTIVTDTLYGGETDTLYIPITADPLHHGVVGPVDELFTVEVEAIEANDGMIGAETYTENDDTIGVVQTPELHLVDVDFFAANPHPSGYFNAFGNEVLWLNRNQKLRHRFALASTDGDYATIDSLALLDAFVQYTVGGEIVYNIDGVQQPFRIRDYQNLIDINVLAPGDTGLWVFELTDSGVPPWHEDTLAVRFVANFHDANRADAEFAFTSPFDTMMNTLLVDVTPPNVAYFTPNASNPWPIDNNFIVDAWDNHSGVDSVFLRITGAGGMDWNGVGWVPNYDFILTYNAGTGKWWANIPEPTGSFTCRIWAKDKAGNSGEKILMPRGTVANIHIFDVWSTLPRTRVAGEEWEADWYQEHSCTVHVYNEYSDAMNNVRIGLRSTSAHTLINGAAISNNINIGTINAGQHVKVVFNVVREPNYDCVDTLIAFLHSANPVGSYVVGEISTDRLAIIHVQKPAHVFVYDVWNEQPVQLIDSVTYAPDRVVAGVTTFDEPNTYHHEYQPYTVFAKICYEGTDTVEYTRWRFDNNTAPSNVDINSITPEVLELRQHAFNEYVYDAVHGALRCTTITCTYQTDADVCNYERLIDDMFEVVLDSFKFDNWYPIDLDPTTLDSNPYFTQLTYRDNSTHAIVVEPPQIDIWWAWYDDVTSTGYHNHGFIWLNRLNHIDFTSLIWNLYSGCGTIDRATAKLYGKQSYLRFFNNSHVEQFGLAGTFRNFTDPADTLYPTWGDTTNFIVRWDGVTNINTNVGFIENYVSFANQYWPEQLQPAPWNLIRVDLFTGPVYISEEMDTISKWIYYYYPHFAVDVVNPVATIIIPPTGTMYSAWNWPTQETATFTDNFSGVDTVFTQMAIRDPRGRWWNGTAWSITETWLLATRLSGNTFRVPIPVVANLVVNGRYTFFARCKDVAGNAGNTDSTSVIFDNQSPWTRIVHPSETEYVSYYSCASYDNVIQALAWDTVFVKDYSQVAGVESCFVAIKETLYHKWWDEDPIPPTPRGWINSPVAIYNLMDYDGDELWQWNDVDVPYSSYVLKIYTYAVDRVRNFTSPTDSAIIVVDCDKPVPYLTGNTFVTAPPESIFGTITSLTAPTWATVMGNAIYGSVIDTITEVDEVQLSISKDDSLWWDNITASWVATTTPIWFYPDRVWDFAPGVGVLTNFTELHAGTHVLGADTVWFDYNWAPDGPGCYSIYAKAWDDVDNVSDDDLSQLDAKTSWWRFTVDNMLPDRIFAYMPKADTTYNHMDWASLFNDTLWIVVEDSTPGCMGWWNNVGNMQYSLQHFNETTHEAQWWAGVPFGGWRNSYQIINLNFGRTEYLVVGGRNIARHYWWTWIPRSAIQVGVYHGQVFANSVTGEYITYNYTFRISNPFGHINCVLLTPEPIFAEQPIQLEISAHYPSGVVNSGFFYAVNLFSNYGSGDCIPDLPTTPYYLTGGIDTITVYPECGRENVVIWATSATSGYDQGNTVPFDVISALDNLAGHVEDVTPDQGNQIRIVHEVSPKDPFFVGAGIDTTTIKVTAYEYQFSNDGFLWNTLIPTTFTRLPGNMINALYSPGDLDFHDYRVIVHYRTNFGDPLIDFDTLVYIPLGAFAAIDNVAPDTIADLHIEQTALGQVRLWWDAIIQGFNGSAEIDPATNVDYKIYKSTGNPFDATSYVHVATVGTPEYFEALPFNPIATPTYYYVCAIDRGPNEGAASEKTGRTSYNFDLAGRTSNWVNMAVPFKVEAGGATLEGSELAAYLAPANISNISRMNNVVGDWVGVFMAVPPIDGPVFEGSDALIAQFGANAGVLSVAGNLPTAEGAYALNAGKWNSLMHPLSRTDLTLASQIMSAITSCNSVANKKPAGWDQVVRLGSGTIIGDFSSYPGMGLIVNVDASSTWPSARALVYKENVVSVPVEGVRFVPKALVGEVFGENITFTVTDKAGAIVVTSADYGCRVENNAFMAQLGNVGWRSGEAYIVHLYANGMEVSSIAITSDDKPVQFVTSFSLQTATELPKSFALRSPNPNPFNAATEITFDVPADSRVEIAVFDMTGKKIDMLVSDMLSAGTHSVRWSASENVATGVYFIRMKAGDFTAQEKLMLIK